MGLIQKTANRKPRLIILLNRFVIGGPAGNTIPLAYSLRDNFEVLVLFGEKEKDEVEPAYLLETSPGLQLRKVRHLRRSINPISDAIAFFSLLYTFLKFRPHIVHTHGAKSGFLGRLAAWICNVPIVIHTFHGHFFHSYFSKKVTSLILTLERMVGKLTTAAVALSDSQRNELANVYKIVPAQKITVIPLGFVFNTDQHAGMHRASFRNRYGLKDDDVAIGIVGRIVPVKNHMFFVQVVKRVLSSNHPKASFFIIGDGETRGKIEEEFLRQQIPFNDTSLTPTTKVVFTSWIADNYEIMNGLDIVTLTSLNEGTPLSIIEAAFFKKPVVSTNVGGVKDIIKDSETGFLVDKDDINTFVAKLELLITNLSLREQMGEAGHQLAVERFSKINEVTNTRDFYLSLLRRKGHFFSTFISKPFIV